MSELSFPLSWARILSMMGAQVITTLPLPGAVGVALNAGVRFTFNKPVDMATLVWTCVPDPGGWVPDLPDSPTSRFYPVHNNFAPGTLYTITVTACTDLAGHPLRAAHIFTFTTV